MSDERSGPDSHHIRDQSVPVDHQASRVFDVLSDEWRRMALSYLVEQDSSVNVDALVDQLVTETDTASREVDWPQLELMLHHAHLPKMADAGLIEYDRAAAVVEKTEMANEMAGRLELRSDPQFS